MFLAAAQLSDPRVHNLLQARAAKARAAKARAMVERALMEEQKEDRLPQVRCSLALLFSSPEIRIASKIT